MTTGRQRQRAPNLTPAESYNAAVQFYIDEIRSLGERTNAFLIVQSILVAAFVHIIISRASFPTAFGLIALGISAVGVLFCVLHYLAGRTGSHGASKWRRYMRRIIEKKQPDAPWEWFYRDSEHSCWYKYLYARRPFPSSWLMSPAIFLLVWACAISYTVTSPDFCLNLSQHQTLALIIASVLAIVLLVCCFIAWHRDQENRRN
jgi:hypothetical protein